MAAARRRTRHRGSRRPARTRGALTRYAVHMARQDATPHIGVGIDGPRGEQMRFATAYGILALPFCVSATLAQQPPAQGTGQPATEATPSAPATVTLSQPTMAGLLSLNPNPYHVDLGPFGTTYIGGEISGLGLVQSNAVPGNKTGYLDLDNGQMILQKIDGLFQYFAEIGVYSFPSLGTPYATVGRFTTDTYGPVPVAYAKLAPSDDFSIEAGKLPTLIGIENTFTFENMNVEFGLLANQEPAISRGVQVNYTLGPVAFAVSLNDGFYSGRLNWLTGSATWTIDKANTLVVIGGGNFGHNGYSTFATPLPQNNGSIYNIGYTYSSDPWTISPYVQLAYVPSNASIGIAHSGETYGAAVLGNYRFTPQYSLSGRVEYIASTGSVADAAPNLLYGPGSKAFSLTLAPTFQYNRYFARVEFSYVKAFDTTPGLVFGRTMNATDQVRGLLETGVVF